jgi:hypothetical protein
MLMANTHKKGDVVVQVPQGMTLPPKAGKLTPKELAALPTTRTGVGVVCEDAATTIKRVGDAFTLPRGVTGEALRTAGARAEGFDRIISNLEAILEEFRQGNRIADAEAQTMLSRLYDQVKTQAKDDATLKTEFSSLYAYFNTAPARKKPVA